MINKEISSNIEREIMLDIQRKMQERIHLDIQYLVFCEFSAYNQELNEERNYIGRY